jgi:hypothetical protein
LQVRGSFIAVRHGILAALAVALAAALPAAALAATELTDMRTLGAPGGGRALLPRVARSGDAAYALHFKAGDFGGLKVTRLGDGGTVPEHTAAIPCSTECYPGYDIVADER